jgi:hypothetical protein
MRHFAVALCFHLIGAASLPAQSAQPDDLEKSVNRGLEFLQRAQDADGGWRLGRQKSTAATSLAVMAFLSAGHVPGEGPYGETILKGIRSVLKVQQPGGLLLAEESGYTMYEHGIGTLMLAEVAGMTDAELAPRVKKALEKAVAIILKAQKMEGIYAGGWRYQVTSVDADVSVTGWQMLALKAARNLGCDVPARRVDQAVEFLKRCQDGQTGGFCYQPSSTVTPACTATAVLCLELCHRHHSPEALRGGSLMLRHTPTVEQANFAYGVYYQSQACFQLGGHYWNVFRPRLLATLLPLQKQDGSWSAGRYDTILGLNYSTAMAILALSVEYRYLPIYQRGDDQEVAGAPKGECDK